MVCAKTGLPDRERVWVIVMINCAQSGIFYFILGDFSLNLSANLPQKDAPCQHAYSVQQGGKFSRHVWRPITRKGLAARIQ
jgi:hypothetical protein